MSFVVQVEERPDSSAVLLAASFLLVSTIEDRVYILRLRV